MNIEYFQEFIELAHRLNYREAAATLSMSQSALSKHIQALESEYGTSLFARDRKGVALTADGALLYEYAQQIWTAFEKSKVAVSASRESRPLILAGLVENPEEHMTVAEVMRYVGNHGARRRVQMRNAGSLSAPDQLRALEEGVLDCFVSYELARYADEDRFEVAHICDIPLDIIVSSGSALAEKEEVTFADVSGATFIHLAGPNFTPIWNLIEELLDEGGVPHIVKPVPTNSVYDYIHMDLGGDLLVMPRKRDLAELDQYPEIKLLTVPNPRFKLSLDAAYLKDAENDSLLCLIDALKACYCAIYCQ